MLYDGLGLMEIFFKTDAIINQVLLILIQLNIIEAVWEHYDRPTSKEEF